MTGRLKVVNLGLPKSGTTTLGQALSAAGLRVADWRVRRGNPNATNFGFVGNLMYAAYFNGDNPLALMENFDAFSEIDIIRKGFNLWPQTDWALLSAIRRHNPGTKFVLTMREPAKISDSQRRWSDLGRVRLPTHDVPGLPQPYGKSDAQRIRWIEGHREFCHHVFRGSPDFHEVRVDQPGAREELSAFLGLDLPWWGVANVNKNRAAPDVAPAESTSGNQATRLK